MVPSDTPSTTPALVTERGVLSDMDYELGQITTTEEALAFFASQGIEVTEITDLGDGFRGIDKAELVNIPFIIADYTISMNGKYTDDQGNTLPFVIVRAFSAKGKVRFTDGSTGIAAQILDAKQRGILAGIRVDNGLTVSEYDYYDKTTGKNIPARTYYLGM